MIPNRVKAGSSFTAYVDFFDDNNNSIIATSPVTYAIRDADKNLIIEGTAQQTNQPERWQVNISLPDDITSGGYSITWNIKSQAGSERLTENFEVLNQAPNYREIDQLLPEGAPVSDTLVVGRDQIVTNCSAKIVTPEGTPIYSTTDFETSTDGTRKYLSFKSATAVPQLLAGDSVMAMYIIVWDFTLDGERQTEYDFIYVANYKVIAYIRELKRKIDKAAIQHPNPNLRYNDVDLAAYLNKGLQWINAQPPTQTAWTVASIPDILYSYLLDAAAYEAIDSRLNAEGEAAFNFNGQPITLEVDRTGFLESALSRYENRLQNINAVKKNMVMSGGGGFGSASGNSGAGGILAYSIGPTLQISPFGINSRSPFYQVWIQENTGYTNSF